MCRSFKDDTTILVPVDDSTALALLEKEPTPEPALTDDDTAPVATPLTAALQCLTLPSGDLFEGDQDQWLQDFVRDLLTVTGT